MNEMIQRKATAKETKILNVGFENRIVSQRIVAIINPNSAPVKRMITEAKERGILINATGGKPKRSAIVTDSNHVILSSISPRKIGERMERRSS